MTFNKRIQIQREVKEGQGSFADTEWKTEKEVWAHWVNVHGSEVWVAESVQAQKPATVTLRYGQYTKTIDETCRIVYKDTPYDIVSIDNVKEQNRILEIKVKAVKNG